MNVTSPFSATKTPAPSRRTFVRLGSGVLAASALSATGIAKQRTTFAPKSGDLFSSTHYRTVDVRGVEIFYREAGPKRAPVVLLLHGFPSSFRMFRNLIPFLAKKYVATYFALPQN